MILRDAFLGLTRFDQFRKSLRIAPDILSRRLRGLVEAGLLEKFRHTARPRSDEYRLTRLGHDLAPVLRALFAWGEAHLAHQVDAAEIEANAAAPPVHGNTKFRSLT